MTEPDYRPISLWLDTLSGSLEPRDRFEGRDEVDVAIVGAGYSGLWTAYYLSQVAPQLSVAIVEAEIAGFGASGRNGGWCVGMLAGTEGLLARPARRAEGLALERAAFEAVDEVGRVCRTEGIECDYQKGGSLRVATTPRQREAIRHHVEQLREWGFERADFQWLEPDECEAHARVAGCLGGSFTPHCAAVNPARLARGLADVVEGLGVRIFERSPATAIEPGRVITASGDLRAQIVVRATEGYTRNLPGHKRRLVPIHSMMIATEPLSEDLWEQIGFANRPTLGDGRRITVYGVRTADDRIAFGARGVYHYGSGIEDRFRPDDPRFDEVRRALLQLFPVVEEVAITHRWGGPLGVPRSFAPSLGLDRSTGLAWLGGYVGEGVAAANLAGRTLAELIAGESTERTGLAWVGRATRAWEPEPLRWLAVRSISQLGDWADRADFQGRSSSRLPAWLFDRLTGR